MSCLPAPAPIPYGVVIVARVGLSCPAHLLLYSTETEMIAKEEEEEEEKRRIERTKTQKKTHLLAPFVPSVSSQVAIAARVYLIPSVHRIPFVLRLLLYSTKKR